MVLKVVDHKVDLSLYGQRYGATLVERDATNQAVNVISISETLASNNSRRANAEDLIQ